MKKFKELAENDKVYWVGVDFDENINKICRGDVRTNTVWHIESSCESGYMELLYFKNDKMPLPLKRISDDVIFYDYEFGVLYSTDLGKLEDAVKHLPVY